MVFHNVAQNEAQTASPAQRSVTVHLKGDFLWPTLGFTGSTQVAQGKMGRVSTSLLRVNLTHPLFMGKEGELA